MVNLIYKYERSSWHQRAQNLAYHQEKRAVTATAVQTILALDHSINEAFSDIWSELYLYAILYVESYNYHNKN
jgi:hypothetical protein